MARKRNQDSNDFPSFKRPQLNLKHETRKGVLIVLFLVLAIVFVLSLVGLAGPFGSITNRVLKLAFGWVAYLVPLIFMFVAFALFRQKSEDDASSVSTHAYVGAVLITLTLTGFLHLLMLRSNINRAFDLVKEGAGGGVKLSQIAGLQNDLALSLAASSLRMELPIPGKALVGVEIPNKSAALVRVKDIIGNAALSENPSKVAFALGRDVAGHPMVADLAKMPHLLIAGATGTGKSVAINSI